MDRDTWETIEAILDEALELKGQARLDYLNKACGDDQELYNEVLKLLRSIAESEKTHFLEEPYTENKAFIQSLSETSSDSSDDFFIGRQIGPYKITEQVGSGGMGGVFRAIRIDEAFQQQVAIKLLHHGLHLSEVMRRFRKERQILADLAHPNIARLYDGGITGDGHPYLIMEFIDGQPIDRYCDEKRLSIGERLTLFKDVCEAIQFAHRNLVIHRDLKTKNIYATAEGHIKVLDFGIAKLLNPNLSGEDLEKTHRNYQFWTPYYAAPEQVRNGTITTATDIYSLGILLQRLLTDTYPYDFEDKSLAEIRSIISEQPPAKLLRALSKNTHLQETAWQRRISVSDLKKIASSDLAAIVNKAIRHQPDERYSSVSQLIDDLERYQHHLPVSAQRPKLGYRLKKFGARHKTGIAIAVAIFFLIGGLTAIYTNRLLEEKKQAKFEASKALQVKNLLTDILKESSPFNQANPNITLREVLDKGASQINHKLQNKPVVKSELMGLMGLIYTNLGLYPRGKRLLTDAIRLEDSTHNNDSALYINNLSRLAYLLFRQEKYHKSEKLYLDAIRQAKQIYGPNAPKIASLYHDIGLLYDEMGQRERAVSYYKRALNIIQPGQKPLKAVIFNDWGIIYQKQGHFQSAIKLIKKSIRMQRSFSDTLTPNLASSFNDLAYTYQRYGKLKKADSLHQVALAMREKIFGPNHPHIASSLVRYGLLKIQEGKPDQAEPMLKRGYDILRKRLPDSHWEVLSAKGALALARGLQGKAEQNLPILKSVYQVFIKRFGQQDWRTQEARKAYLKLSQVTKYNQQTNKLNTQRKPVENH
ncbi:MAG TPA: serine/threonine-protein kinase [Balneolaceae bacterium]|nr:serine/threonine-protein kinase [Balneolaceae bacterium]